MVIINNNHQNHLHLHTAPKQTANAEALNWQSRVMQLLQNVLFKIPPQQLNRDLRTFFMLYLTSLQTIPPGFTEQVLDMMEIFEILDTLNDSVNK